MNLGLVELLMESEKFFFLLTLLKLPFYFCTICSLTIVFVAYCCPLKFALVKFQV